MLDDSGESLASHVQKISPLLEYVKRFVKDDILKEDGIGYVYLSILLGAQNERSKAGVSLGLQLNVAKSGKYKVILTELDIFNEERPIVFERSFFVEGVEFNNAGPVVFWLDGEKK